MNDEYGNRLRIAFGRMEVGMSDAVPAMGLGCRFPDDRTKTCGKPARVFLRSFVSGESMKKRKGKESNQPKPPVVVFRGMPTQTVVRVAC